MYPVGADVISASWHPLRHLNRKLLDRPALFIAVGVPCISLAWPGSLFA
jgi:hypothetical protein